MLFDSSPDNIISKNAWVHLKDIGLNEILASLGPFSLLTAWHIDSC